MPLNEVPHSTNTNTVNPSSTEPFISNSTKELIRKVAMVVMAILAASCVVASIASGMHYIPFIVLYGTAPGFVVSLVSLIILNRISIQEEGEENLSYERPTQPDDPPPIINPDDSLSDTPPPQIGTPTSITSSDNIGNFTPTNLDQPLLDQPPPPTSTEDAIVIKQTKAGITVTKKGTIENDGVIETPKRVAISKEDSFPQEFLDNFTFVHVQFSFAEEKPEDKKEEPQIAPPPLFSFKIDDLQIKTAVDNANTMARPTVIRRKKSEIEAAAVAEIEKLVYYPHTELTLINLWIEQIKSAIKNFETVHLAGMAPISLPKAEDVLKKWDQVQGKIQKRQKELANLPPLQRMEKEFLHVIEDFNPTYNKQTGAKAQFEEFRDRLLKLIIDKIKNDFYLIIDSEQDVIQLRKTYFSIIKEINAKLQKYNSSVDLQYKVEGLSDDDDTLLQSTFTLLWAQDVEPLFKPKEKTKDALKVKAKSKDEKEEPKAIEIDELHLPPKFTLDNLEKGVLSLQKEEEILRSYLPMLKLFYCFPHHKIHHLETITKHVVTYYSLLLLYAQDSTIVIPAWVKPFFKLCNLELPPGEISAPLAEILGILNYHHINPNLSTSQYYQLLQKLSDCCIDLHQKEITLDTIAKYYGVLIGIIPELWSKLSGGSFDKADVSLTNYIISEMKVISSYFLLELPELQVEFIQSNQEDKFAAVKSTLEFTFNEWLTSHEIIDNLANLNLTTAISSLNSSETIVEACKYLLKIKSDMLVESTKLALAGLISVYITKNIAPKLATKNLFELINDLNDFLPQDALDTLVQTFLNQVKSLKISDLQRGSVTVKDVKDWCNNLSKNLLTKIPPLLIGELVTQAQDFGR